MTSFSFPKILKIGFINGFLEMILMLFGNDDEQNFILVLNYIFKCRNNFIYLKSKRRNVKMVQKLLSFSFVFVDCSSKKYYFPKNFQDFINMNQKIIIMKLQNN